MSDPEFRPPSRGAPRSRGRLHELSAKPRLSEDEELEEKRLKKEKLLLKDRMEAISRHRRVEVPTEDSDRPRRLGIHLSSPRRRGLGRAHGPPAGGRRFGRAHAFLPSVLPRSRAAARGRRGHDRLARRRHRAVSIVEAPEAPAGARRRLSVFMSVFNCHVNRAPVTGRLGRRTPTCGGRKKRRSRRRRPRKTSRTASRWSRPPGSVTFKQIAGALARRIVFYPRVGRRARHAGSASA